MKYWSIDPILSKNCDINLIIGQRSNGKTFGSLKYVLQQYKKTRKRFCYIRRWVDDTKGFRAEGLFGPLQPEVEKLFGKDYYIYYYRHKFYLCNDQGEKLDVIGYVVALSEAAHTKSVAFENIGTVIFDEFIQMAGETILRDEMQKYENTLSTLLRTNNEAKIFLLANTVSKFSMYLTMYGFDIDKLKQGTITVKEFDTDAGILRVGLEYCEYNEEVGKASSKYVVSKMITKGQWEIPEVDDIPQTEGERVKEKLLCSIFEPDADVNIGVFLRIGKWYTLEKEPNTLVTYQKEHVREFLVLRVIEEKSRYFHLTTEKSLTYNVYNDLKRFLDAIKENTEIDITNELFMGRIFSDNMFTADYFNHAWGFYGRITTRAML